jgi:uncharacterized protein YndB with AHSA1/START domain
MPEIVTDIVINAPAAAVFDYATTPAHWPRFWPITLSVSGDVARPAAVGARWTEQVKVSFWRGEFHWEAAERTHPTRFVMRGQSQGHGWLGRLLPSEPGCITYTLTETAGRTHFHRVMDYADANAFVKLMDVLFMRRAMRRAIDEALHALKDIMESNGAAGRQP